MLIDMIKQKEFKKYTGYSFLSASPQYYIISDGYSGIYASDLKNKHIGKLERCSELKKSQDFLLTIMPKGFFSKSYIIFSHNKKEIKMNIINKGNPKLNEITAASTGGEIEAFGLTNNNKYLISKDSFGFNAYEITKDSIEMIHNNKFPFNLDEKVRTISFSGEYMITTNGENITSYKFNQDNVSLKLLNKNNTKNYVYRSSLNIYNNYLAAVFNQELRIYKFPNIQEVNSIPLNNLPKKIFFDKDITLFYEKGFQKFEVKYR